MLICPSDFLPGDLNFAIPAGTNPYTLQDYLRSRSYVSIIRSKARSIPSRPSLLHHVEILEHLNLKRRIHLSFYSTDAVPAILLDSNSTLLANCITADAFICLFPASTLRKEGIRLQKGTTAEGNFSKYVRRGFTLIPQVKSNAQDLVFHTKSSAMEPILCVALAENKPPVVRPFEWTLPFRPTNGTFRRHKLGLVSTCVDGFGAF
ncbi:hypothetical protein HYPSUDRAFT_210378 [Hypholoma sublateritium FD-334 SS-4]|uniref:Uncharacterized protein n=1 Tax=Hypholoma sublateritium (strain FD-334 SS-4) TaxID=945553 RepID=A0A0D2NVI6_HYPSF|nr:hypothetical protein HYPSUDRAFT_210378 [Hypholoma sublateritium FD-334 SS-4]